MRPAAPWPRRGRWWLFVGQTACLAAIATAGRASAERPSTDGQAVWVAVAVAAALISAAGNGIWLGTVRRATDSRRRLVIARLAGPTDALIEADTAAPPVIDGGSPVMVPGLTLRHRPGCALVAGKSTVPATPDTRPCGWCSA